MPAGVPLGQYLRFTFTALFTMGLGSQTVHLLYRPLEDFDKYLDRELESLPEEVRKDIASKIAQQNQQMTSPAVGNSSN